MNVKTLLYESVALREAFGVIAHQWRQPLSHINALVSSIDNRLYELGIEDPLIAKKLVEIEKITKEMSKSIDSYRGYFNEEKESLSIKQIFENVSKNMQYSLDSKGINLEININVNENFFGDGKLLEEIIITIINNSIDALVTRNIYKPFVKLSVWNEIGCLFIKICDNAGGVSKSIMKKIFEPDFTTKHASEGTGIGLFMVKKLLDEKMNALLEVKNVESGVCFTLQLPRKYDE
jgi:signal transduction histidine kinase